jgi:signal transduction histidine kinase
LFEDPVGFIEKAVASCYRNRSLLAIPDTQRSPFFQGNATAGFPRSAMFVPMFAQNDLMGVLDLEDADRVRHYSQDEQAAAQHLANQLAIGMKLLERQAFREQLFRSEKLAATGQLISSVANELQAPLEAIANYAETVLLSHANSPAAPELRAISTRARNATNIVARLLSFAKTERKETTPIDLSSLLRNLLKIRDRAWREREIELHDLLPLEAVLIEGSRSHLEEVLLSLLAHAEHSVKEADKKSISIRATRLGGSVELEISFPSSAVMARSTDPFEEEGGSEAGALSLTVCRSIVRGHGGELRIAGGSGQNWRFELDLPAAQRAEAVPSAIGAAVSKPDRPLTILLMDPELTARQKLLTLLSDSGHRSVPVGSAEEAIDLSERLHFHAVFCSVRQPALNWVEFLERIRGRVDAFVLLAEGYDDDLSSAVQSANGYLLSEPVEPEHLNRVLGMIGSQLAAHAR